MALRKDLKEREISSRGRLCMMEHLHLLFERRKIALIFESLFEEIENKHEPTRTNCMKFTSQQKNHRRHSLAQTTVKVELRAPSQSTAHCLEQPLAKVPEGSSDLHLKTISAQQHVLLVPWRLLKKASLCTEHCKQL